MESLGLGLIRPPAVRDYATSHGWYRFRAIFCGDREGVDINLYLRALQAEGVHAVRTRDRLMHEEPLLVGGAAPAPRFARYLYRDSVARDDYDSSVELASRTLEVRVPPQPVDGLVEQYGHAFEKVDDALRTSPNRHAIGR